MNIIKVENKLIIEIDLTADIDPKAINLQKIISNYIEKSDERKTRTGGRGRPLKYLDAKTEKEAKSLAHKTYMENHKEEIKQRQRAYYLKRKELKQLEKQKTDNTAEITNNSDTIEKVN